MGDFKKGIFCVIFNGNWPLLWFSLAQQTDCIAKLHDDKTQLYLKIGEKSNFKTAPLPFTIDG